MTNTNVIFFGYNLQLSNQLLGEIQSYYSHKEQIDFSKTSTISLLPEDSYQDNNIIEEEVVFYENNKLLHLKLVDLAAKNSEVKDKIIETYDGRDNNVFICVLGKQDFLEDADKKFLRKIYTLFERRGSLNNFFCIVDGSELDYDVREDYIRSELNFLFKDKQNFFDARQYNQRVFFIDFARELDNSEQPKFSNFMAELKTCCEQLSEEVDNDFDEEPVLEQEEQEYNTDKLLRTEELQETYEVHNMVYKTENFIRDLDKVSHARQEFADYLSQTADIITEAEETGSSASGQLGLENTIADLSLVSKNLRENEFRLLVLGDMKRGKSTFLNALIGEKVLPTDVNPCTAVLTVLSYGDEKQVTVYFNDGRQPDTLNFESFKTNYTIDPEEAKKLQEEGKPAFPHVAYAEVKYPLEILEKGVQIIDSPGLNDTEARNQLTLGYINNCHAILFVLSATQQFTLGEQRYLENYIQGQGLTVFFLINAWDEIQRRLVDPDDLVEKQEAEQRVRRVFQTNLANYCIVDNEDKYSERVFEVSSLNALRQRIKNPPGSLEGTGFSEFIEELSTFLTKERAISELRQAKALIRQSYSTTVDAVERRIPLLRYNINELKVKIRESEPEFDKLSQIRNDFKDEIKSMGERKANELSASFSSYVLNLDKTFESDFVRYQPDLKFIDFLRKNKRKEFESSLQQAFEMYLNDIAAAWGKDAQREMDSAFTKLAISASQYGKTYIKVADNLSEKLTGEAVALSTDISQEDRSPRWVNWAIGITGSLTTGNVDSVAMAGTGIFNWKQMLLNIGSVAVVGFILGPVGMVLAGLGLGGLSAEMTRRKVVKAMKDGLVKLLPKIASEQSSNVYQVVKDCFENYQKEVVQKMDEDIQTQRKEINELIQQREAHEINRETEIQRLQHLKHNVHNQMLILQDAYDKLLG
ncbi:hypothetical protein RIVM261_041180 [Rivularia sp. IAM M-261]|nr:hypothetical protein RIVM261_041180 [Rivularia sp. IAM M-261]